MKLLKVFLVISLMFLSEFAYGKDSDADLVIEKSLEIFGAEEKPRVIFILPEYKPDFLVFQIDKDYLINMEKMIKRDFKKVKK